MIKIVVNLGSKKGKNREKSSPQLTGLHNSLLMIVVNTLEKYLSNFDGKSDMGKLRTSSVKSSSKLFSCSICAMYKKVNRAQKQQITFK